jgi:hypothetical protein
MAVTLDATVGGASANVYVTVVEADAYLEARLNSSAWTGTEPKKIALVEATREVSLARYQGNVAADTQALTWPRTGVVDPDATSSYTEYASDVIPQRVKDATCELALEFLKAGTTDIAALDSKQNVIQKTVGPLSTTYSDPSQRATGIARYPRVMKLLSPLLAVGVGQVRLTR